ncbi:MAG: DUF4476 domain-containing protein [Flavobacteriales bacterium]|nr:DUF4476 domain-containing protein [Flavobacteriales bacterium]
MKNYLFLLLFLSNSALAQVSHATFYSKEGYLFTIYLNGKKMNEEPQTEVRVINLTQPYYACKAVFEDPALAPAERKILQLTDANGNRVDATFVVEHSRKGDMKIGWKSQSLFPRYIEEVVTPTVVVVNNGAAQQEVVRTTTTRTVESNSEGVSMSFGGIGGRVNINTGYSEPVVEEVTTTTTTVAANPTANTASLPCAGTILSNQDYEMALKSVSLRSSEDGKLTAAKQIVSSNCFTTDQVRRMVELLNTEEARLDLAIYAYPFVLDKGSYFKMNGVFAKEESIDVMNTAILK